jgi:hypothetical protein
MPASVYAQSLIAAGLSEHSFVALLDNSPVKQGSRLYGTKLKVAAPRDVLPTASRPLVVLNGGAHDAEIAAGLSAIRSDTGIVFVGGEVEPA